MDRATPIENLDKTVYISQSTNTPWKDMNPIILLPAMSRADWAL